jgi:superfamily I DNA/RNA helicase
MLELTEEQKKFLSTNGDVVLHACPGSGKTAVVAQKFMQYLDHWDRAHQGVAVLSFTNVASEEIKRQTYEFSSKAFMVDYPHYVGTLDSFINNFILLRFGYLFLSPYKRPIIVFNDSFNLPFRYWRGECHRNGCVNKIGEFRWNTNGQLLRKSKLVECSGPAQYGPPCFQYKRMLMDKGLIYQSDAPTLAYILLSENPEIAKALAARFPIIILDEAQDTSNEQMAILDLVNQAGTESMFLVGDPDQSIYEWRNATPDCFINKMNSTNWHTIKLTTNFRSSQLICNATKLFSFSLENGNPNVASGTYKNYVQKPVLLLYKGNIDDCKNSVINKFMDICNINNISISSSNIAIVTRGNVHSDTDIDGLWKSNEISFLAQASYEWSSGSRKKAYELCEKALFGLVIKEYSDIKNSIEIDVEEKMSYLNWHSIVIDLLVSLPTADLSIGEWTATMKITIESIYNKYTLNLINNKTFENIIKIKSKDKKVPHFKEIPLRYFFETKDKSSTYNISSVHGVKGETYDALMLIIKSEKGKTLTPKFLNEGPLDSELMRIAYVAMTRPRKLLVVAMPARATTECQNQRFPITNWEYISLN